MFGTIGGLIQGDPEPFIKSLGISDLGIFAISVHAIGMIIAVFILLRTLKSNKISLSIILLKGSLTKQNIFYALLAAGIAFVFYPALEHVLELAGIGMYWFAESNSHLKVTGSLDIFLVIASAIVIAPITEEIIFRGYLFNMFIHNGKKQHPAALFSILIFTSVHIFFGPGLMIYIIFWSVIPIFLMLKFKSIYPSILFHVVNNLLAYLVLPLFGI